MGCVSSRGDHRRPETGGADPLDRRGAREGEQLTRGHELPRKRGDLTSRPHGGREILRRLRSRVTDGFTEPHAIKSGSTIDPARRGSAVEITRRCGADRRILIRRPRGGSGTGSTRRTFGGRLPCLGIAPSWWSATANSSDGDRERGRLADAGVEQTSSDGRRPVTPADRGVCRARLSPPNAMR